MIPVFFSPLCTVCTPSGPVCSAVYDLLCTYWIRQTGKGASYFAHTFYFIDLFYFLVWLWMKKMNCDSRNCCGTDYFLWIDSYQHSVHSSPYCFRGIQWDEKQTVLKSSTCWTPSEQRSVTLWNKSTRMFAVVYLITCLWFYKHFLSGCLSMFRCNYTAHLWHCDEAVMWKSQRLCAFPSFSS